MSWINRLARLLEPLAIRHLTLIIVAGQLLALVAINLKLVTPDRIFLVPTLVFYGEWWRLLTFAFMPATTSLIWGGFALYLIYLYGTALEHFWGPLRYNLFLLCGYVLTVGLAFITPDWPATNLFIVGALFLAFAYLNPDFELYIFFVLPVKIKWIALLTWLMYGVMFFTGGLSAKLSIAAAVGNFLIFFAKDIVLRMRQGQRRMQTQSQRVADKVDNAQARHRCYVCGKTNLSHPQEDFRYCSKCAGDYCYCSEHLRNHEHVVAKTDK